MRDDEIDVDELSDKICKVCERPIEVDSLGIDEGLCIDCFIAASQQKIYED